jgi:DNA-binding MarR family transcriptional regulator
MADESFEQSRASRLDPVLDFLRLLWNIEHRLKRTSKRMRSTLGITGPQRLVLRIVGQFPGVSAGELAEIVHLHPSTITGVLQRLVQKGLLARERDPLDSRRVRLKVQPRGKRLTQSPAGTVEFAVAHVLADAPARDVRAARQVLSALATALVAEAID